MAHVTQVKTVTKNYRSAINDMHNGKRKQRFVQISTVDAKTVHKEATQKKDTTSRQQYYTTAKACRYREELGYSNRQLGLQQKPSYSLFL